MNYINDIISFLNCECELIENPKSAEAVFDAYKEMLSKGKSEGFTPVIIIPSEVMCDVMGDFYSICGSNSPSDIIAKSKDINVANLLEQRLKYTMPEEEEFQQEVIGEFQELLPVKNFISLLDYGTSKIYDRIIIAKIPTCNPWEVAAWIPNMAGGNEFPLPEEQIAIFKHWYEKYGAVPTIAHFDIWELYVENPVQTQEAAVDLAWEQFSFCSDVVHQGVGTVKALASALLDSNVWYFWWD